MSKTHSKYADLYSQLLARTSRDEARIMAALASGEKVPSAAVAARLLIPAQWLLKGIGEAVELLDFCGSTKSGSDPMQLFAEVVYGKKACCTAIPAYIDELAPVIEKLLEQSKEAFGREPLEREQIFLNVDDEQTWLELSERIAMHGGEDALSVVRKLVSTDGDERARLVLALFIVGDAIKLANHLNSVSSVPEIEANCAAARVAASNHTFPLPSLEQASD